MRRSGVLPATSLESNPAFSISSVGMRRKRPQWIMRMARGTGVKPRVFMLTNVMAPGQFVAHCRECIIM